MGAAVIGNLLRSEYRKTATVKLWWAMGLGPLAVGVLSGSLSLAVFGGSFSGSGSGSGLGSSAVGGAIGLVTALFFLLMFSAIFGAVNSAGEYRHKTISTTFLTTRSRGRSVLAKLTVTALVGVLYAVVIEIVTITLIAIVGKDLPSVDGQVVGFLAMAVIVTVLWTLMGAGLGTLLASSVASAVGIVVYYLLGELLLTALLNSAGAEELNRFLPQQATVAAIVGIGSDFSGLLPWWGGLLTLTGWAALLCMGGWAVTRVRDVG